MKAIKATLLVCVCMLAGAIHAQLSGVNVANNFAKWTVFPNNGVLNWSDTKTCRPAALSGQVFPAFKAGSPVRIIDANPAMSETATVSSISYSGGGCAVNINFANPHTTYVVQSATGGLQEAMNWSLEQGTPQTVEITPNFTGAGLTTATIQAAQGSALVNIQDERNGNIVNWGWNGTTYVQTSSSLVGSVTSTTYTGTTTLGPTAMFTTAASGQYQLCGYLGIKAVGTGSGGFAAVFTYVSDGNAETQQVGNTPSITTVGAQNTGVSGSNTPSCTTSYIDANTAVSYELLASGTISTAPTVRYSFKVTYQGP